MVEARLHSLRGGAVEVRSGDASTIFGTNATGPGTRPLRAVVCVHDDRFWRRAALSGSLGVAEAYLDGWWSCDDLTSLLRIFVRDMTLADQLDRGGARLKSLAVRLAHALRRNTRKGSRRNIQDHYDLGNDFFSIWLDETLTYSCGLFETPNAGLHDAQVAKLHRLCRLLDLRADDHLLEIGTGWGSLALHAAQTFGCRVTTTTISQQQFDFATCRVREAGLGDRVTVLLRDYRDLTGQFDKLISIEMIEAVGHRFLPTFFRMCAALVKPNGVMALQAITMPDHRYDAYRRHPDFIQRYVFPGSCCPSLAAMTSAVSRASDFRVRSVEDIGLHYARTLRLWRERFFDRIDDVRRLGYSDRLIRLWEYYLCYCEAGFAEQYIGDVHMLLSRPGFRSSAEVLT